MARTTSTTVAALFERRQPDQDVDLADRHQLPEQRVGERALVLHGVIGHRSSTATVARPSALRVTSQSQRSRNQ